MKDTTPEHGTAAEYKRGCRCESCRSANTEIQRHYRATMIAKHGCIPSQAKRNSDPNRKRYDATYATKTCSHCRSTFKTTTSVTVYCEACFKRQVWKASYLHWKQCDWCLGLHNKKTPHCSNDCKRFAADDRAKASRGPLRAAIEDGKHDAIISIIKADVEINSDGCWIWTRKIKRGYPIANAGRMMLVHRIVLEAKHGKKLGSQAAHHVCANTTCVNPEHLQPVTHRDNTAEMLARQSYLARIKELETALAAVDPDHPLLAVIEVA